MEQRYQIFGKTTSGTSWASTTERSPARRGPGFPALPGIGAPPVDDGIEVPDHLPYIVVIIDELAD